MDKPPWMTNKQYERGQRHNGGGELPPPPGDGPPPPPPPPPPLALPPIEIRVGETTRVVNELERRLIASNLGLYQRGAIIVSTGFTKMPTHDGGEVITQIIDKRGDHALVEDAEAVAEFRQLNKRGKMAPCAPPMRLIHTLKDRAHRLRLPVLTGIVNCPSISTDGELLDRPGYDPRTGILFDPLGVTFPRVPDLPTRADAMKALARILELLATFDFVSDDDRAVALSLILTSVARRGLPFAPLHGFDAPVAGAGKSKIVDLASIISTGHEAGSSPSARTRTRRKSGCRLCSCGATRSSRSTIATGPSKARCSIKC
jgi:putative DNA primase/helicase